MYNDSDNNSPLFSKYEGHFLFKELKDRKYSRIYFNRQAVLKFISNSYENCRIRNISLTGLFVIGSFRQEVGEKCIISIVQSGISSDLSLQASAKVVRKSDEGIAIKFTSMPFDSYMLLQTSLLYESEEPFAIGLELPENCPFTMTDQLPELSEGS